VASRRSGRVAVPFTMLSISPHFYRNLSHTIYELDCFRKSTPPQNRGLIVSIRNSNKQVDDFVGELTF